MQIILIPIKRQKNHRLKPSEKLKGRRFFAFYGPMTFIKLRNIGNRVNAFENIFCLTDLAQRRQGAKKIPSSKLRRSARRSLLAARGVLPCGVACAIPWRSEIRRLTLPAVTSDYLRLPKFEFPRFWRAKSHAISSRRFRVAWLPPDTAAHPRNHRRRCHPRPHPPSAHLRADSGRAATTVASQSADHTACE